jgi:hypothetical protein
VSTCGARDKERLGPVQRYALPRSDAVGTDIEFFVERRSNGRWELLFDYETAAPGFLEGRPYGLYPVLAGVRKPFPGFVPIAPPRGFPTDLSRGLASVVQREYSPRGDHVPVRWTETYRDYAAYFDTYGREELAGLGAPEDVRAVFWFNS